METILNQILSEQKKQTKLLQTIASSQEQREIVANLQLDGETLARAIHDPLSLDKNKRVTCHF